MSKTARSISTSVAALCLALGALGAHADDAPPPPPRPVVRVVGLVPAKDAAVQAALVRGLERALGEASTAKVRWVLRVSATPEKWSNAGPATVRLIFREGAEVLVTPPDHRVAHLMAQVATRVQVPLVTTSSAPTVATTGSNVLQKVPSAKTEAAPDWEAIGYRAGRKAVAP